MKTDGCIEDARELWRSKNAGKTCCDKLLPMTSYDCPFGITGLITAGLNPAQQFMGKYKVDIIPTGNYEVRFHISNTTSLTSFLYGLGPSPKTSE
jgi:hypothetical protein